MNENAPAASSAPDEATAIAATRQWIERAVIGLNLCPFARLPYLDQRVCFRVSRANGSDGVLDDLCGELQSLAAADPADCETTLLIIPQAFADFLDFNDFLDEAEAALEVLGLDGEIQIASFHPDYRFADSDPDDVENCSNRSPFPTLHLLREASIERAVESIADPDAIFERNIETLRRLGREGWKSLWRTRPDGA
jgi:uncharacterized protein